MQVTAKFGFTAADALRLLREAKKVHIFVGEDMDRYILEVSKPAIARELKATEGDRSRLCYLSIDDRTLYLGSLRAKYHAQHCRDSAQRRLLSSSNGSRGDSSTRAPGSHPGDRTDGTVAPLHQTEPPIGSSA